MTSHFKVPSKQIKKIPLATFAEDELTISLSTAAASFNMSCHEFQKRFILTRKIRFNVLHQLNLHDVQVVYDRIFKKAYYSPATDYRSL